MVDGDSGPTGMLVPRVVAVGNTRGRGTAIIQNHSAVVQIVLLMDQPVRTVKHAMTMIAQVTVSKRWLVIDGQLLNIILYNILDSFDLHLCHFVFKKSGQLFALSRWTLQAILIPFEVNVQIQSS